MHYDTPEDVLEEIQNDFLDKNKVYLILWKDQYIQNPDILTSIFEFMQENKEIMQVLFGPNGNSSFIDSMQELVKNPVIATWHSEYPSIRQEYLEFNYEFVFTGCMREILNWVNDRTEITFDTLASRLERLGYYCLVAAENFKK